MDFVYIYINLYKVASTKIKLWDQKIKSFGKVYVL